MQQIKVVHFLCKFNVTIYKKEWLSFCFLKQQMCKINKKNWRKRIIKFVFTELNCHFKIYRKYVFLFFKQHFFEFRFVLIFTLSKQEILVTYLILIINKSLYLSKSDLGQVFYLYVLDTFFSGVQSIFMLKIFQYFQFSESLEIIPLNIVLKCDEIHLSKAVEHNQQITIVAN